MHCYCSASVFDFSCLEHVQSPACSVITKISPTISTVSTVESATLSMWLPLSGAQTCFMNIFESSLYFSDPCFSHLVKLMGQTSDRKLQTCRPFPSPVFTKIVLFRKLQSRRENLWTQVSPKIITQTSTFTTLGKVSIFNLYWLPLSGQNRWGALLY